MSPTTARSRPNLDPHLPNIRTDLATLEDDLRWAHADAWWPTRTDPNAPRTTTPAAPRVDDDPDHIPGPKYAIGVGDDTSRQALADVAGHLRTIELHLAAAVFHTGLRSEQPALRQPTSTSRLDELLAAINSSRWRLDALHDDAHLLDPHQRAVALGQLRRARTASDRAVRRLTRALDRGARTGTPVDDPKCRICGIRPQALRSNGRPSKGRRCDTCAAWFTRNGAERPRTLDAADVEEALAAAGRRRSRGEGWGFA